MRTLWILLMLAAILEARENPFAPAVTVGSEPLITPVPTPDLDKELIPVIKAAQCVAAPEAPAPKKQQASKKVWKNFPPKKEARETKAEKAQKPVIKHKKKRLHKVKHLKQRKKRYISRFHRIYRNDNLSIYLKPRQIKIVTSDCLQKHFKLKKPHRLVLDFGDDFVIYESVDKPLRHSLVKKLKIGTHACFYRVTFVTGRSFRYKLTQKPYGYLITFF